MPRKFSLALLLLFFLPSLALSQTCPAGTSPMPWGVTRDGANNDPAAQLRQIVCMDSNGRIYASFAVSAGVLNASAFDGANAGEKIAACIVQIPASGGVCSAVGLVGTISQNLWSGITKPVVLELGIGTYTLTATQTILCNYCGIRGSGRGTILSVSGVIPAIQIGDGVATTVLGALLRDFELDGNAAGTIGITLQGAQDTRLDRLLVNGFTSDGIKFSSALNNTYNTWVQVSATNNAGRGINDTSGTANSFTCVECRINANTAGGITFGSYNLRLVGGSVETNGSIGVILAGVGGAVRNGAVFDGTYFEGNTTEHIRAGTSGGASFDGLSVHGCTFSAGGITATAMNIANTEGFSVQNNKFLNHNTRSVLFSTVSNNRGVWGPNMYFNEVASPLVGTNPNVLIVENGQIKFGNAAANNLIWQQSTLFGSLGTPANGTFTYCPDCTIANPCAAAGTGALAKRLNAVWVCN